MSPGRAPSRAGRGATQLTKRPATAGDPPWLAKKRDAAWQRHQQTSDIARNDPRWRTFDPRPYLDAPPIDPGTADPATWQADGDVIVLVDGRFEPGVSTAPDGVRVLPLASDDEVSHVHLDATESTDQDVTTLRNMSGWEDGVLVDVLPGAVVRLHIVHVQTSPGLCLPRVLVHVQDGAKAVLLQRFVGEPGAVAVTELHAHPGATLQRDLVQEADLVHTTFARIEQDARIADVQLHFGSGRNTLVARLSGAGAHVDLAGLYLASAGTHTDHWTRVDHAVPDTTSREVYKGILAGDGHAGFTGNVLVQPGAQRSNAQQENRNLLLSRKALAESTPQLEIHADDVQCSHGSTVGRLDDDALFFLRSRGIDEAAAKEMLTKAFAGQVVEMLHDEASRAAATARIEAWFRQAEVA